MHMLILIQNIKHHAIGKLLFSFNEVALGQKIYILFLLGMYFYNIYQNIISCYRFYVNARYIAEEFETTEEAPNQEEITNAQTPQPEQENVFYAGSRRRDS